MSTEGKFDAKKDEYTGAAKEAAGKLTGDKRTQGEGSAQKAQGKGKGAVENAKEAASDVADAAKGFVDRARKSGD